MSYAKVALGRRLFNDPALSVNSTRACATCNVQRRAFSDGRTTPVGALGDVVRRNTMTLTNVAYNAGFGWADSLTQSLEEQMRQPLLNEHPLEMGLTSHDPRVLALLKTERYAQAFNQAFSDDPHPITLENAIRAIAAFERTLISGRSAFDRYVFDDDRAAMSAAARRGMALFYSKRTRCGECHSGINFAGPLRTAAAPETPSAYANTGLYNIDGRGAYPPTDRGLFEQTHDPRDDGRFRIPTLRNVAVSGSYMHDGSIPTLRGVIDHYDRGGRAWNGSKSGRDSLEGARVKPLHLSEDDKNELIAFLRSLTDTESVTSDQ